LLDGGVSDLTFAPRVRGQVGDERQIHSTNLRTIAVAGAGIAGLTTALAFAAKGYRVTILERAEALQEVGAGLQLSPNATRVLIDLGLAPRLESRVLIPDSISVKSGGNGRELTRLELGAAATFRYGAPYWVIHRADLQSALREAVDDHPDITLRLGTTFEDVASHVKGVTVVHRKDGSREQDLAIALVGADGVWSSVRNQFNRNVQPQFSGHVVWRGMADATQLPRGQKSDQVQLWLGSDAHLVSYPMRGGRQVNVVAVVAGTWNRPGWNEPGDIAEISSVFAYGRWSLGARLLINAVTAWRRFALFSLPSSVWQDDRIALVGDASHAMLPFMAQGAGMAIEDAAVLASCFGREGQNPTAAIAQYAAMRKARVERVMRAARLNGKIYHLGGAAAIARNFAIRAMGSQKLMQQNDWLYDWRVS
jgi:salicylate hydroxylase